jgi:hypothetical protein
MPCYDIDLVKNLVPSGIGLKEIPALPLCVYPLHFLRSLYCCHGCYGRNTRQAIGKLCKKVWLVFAGWDYWVTFIWEPFFGDDVSSQHDNQPDHQYESHITCDTGRIVFE